MKKNIAMRVAAFLFILTMISTCAFATTFAKYTTTGSATETARVAKWGVTVTAEAADYVVTDVDGSGQDAQITAGTNISVLVPGSEASFASVDLAGTPEVAVYVTYEAVLELTGWTIPTADENDVDATEEYCPLVFVVGTEEFYIGQTGITTVAELKSKVEKAIAAYSKEYGINQNLAATPALEVSCYWNFVAATPGPAQSEAQDTALGDLATAPKVSLKVTATVTQLD